MARPPSRTPDWRRLARLAGRAVYRAAPPLVTAREVWLYVRAGGPRGHELAIVQRGRDGLVATGAERPRRPPGPVTARATLVDLLRGLVVDVEVRGASAILRRGVLGGALVATALPADEVDATLARYRALGLRGGAAWSPWPTRVVERSYRHGRTTWAIRVDGRAVIERGGRRPGRAPTRAAAIAIAERRIAAREQRGFAPVALDLAMAEHAAPPRPVARPPRDAAPHALIDAAIARLADLHRRLPRGHAVLELADPRTGRARLADLGVDRAVARRVHRGRLGRWTRARARPRAGEDGLAYFARRHGSLTWIVDPALRLPLTTEPVDGVAGAGLAVLAVDPAAWAASPPVPIARFAAWLFTRVHELAALLEPELAAVNDDDDDRAMTRSRG